MSLNWMGKSDGCTEITYKAVAAVQHAVSASQAPSTDARETRAGSEWLRLPYAHTSHGTGFGSGPRRPGRRQRQLWPHAPSIESGWSWLRDASWRPAQVSVRSRRPSARPIRAPRACASVAACSRAVSEDVARCPACGAAPRESLPGSHAGSVARQIASSRGSHREV
eukprot:6212474-Pleurochrysis_carterae.AAC.2